MAKYNIEDIVAYELGSKLVCPKCVDSTEARELIEDQVLTQEALDEPEIWFCDRCGERIH